METRRDVFQAVADPIRREIIGLIAKKEMNLNAIAENFDVTRSAHIQSHQDSEGMRHHHHRTSGKGALL